MAQGSRSRERRYTSSGKFRVDHDPQSPLVKPIPSAVPFRLVVAFAAWLLAAVPAVLQAQSLTFARFDGVVLDSARRPVSGAEVRVEDRSSGATRWTMTARDGRYRFEALPDGLYDVVFEALGYRSIRHLDVRLGVGHPAQLDVFLVQVTTPVAAIDTVPRRGDALSTSNWLVARGFGDLVGERRFSSDIAGLTTTADENSVEGLPWRLTESVIDGARSAGTSAPSGAGGDAAGLALPVRAASTATVGGLGYDVEVGGTGVGISATMRRGGSVPSFQPLVEGGSANLGAGFVGSGPLQGDTAQAVFGADYQRGEREFSRPLPGAPLRVNERTGLFGRLDWQPSDRFAISARASGSRLTSVGEAERTGLASMYGSDYEATAAQASLNVYGRLTRRVSQEWRVSTDFGFTEGRAVGSPRAEFAAGLGGSGPLLQSPFDEARTTPRVSGMLHFDLGRHRVKAGFATAAHRFDSRFARDSDGAFASGDVLLPGPSTIWRRVDASSLAGEFRMRETALFVQDAWRVADGLSVILGARIDNITLPVGRLEQNQEWLTVSAIDNTDLSAKRSNVSPRISIRWELGAAREWVIEGGAGTYQDLADRRDIAEALTFDRGADVRYGVGVSSYPDAPSLAEAPVIGRTMTLLAPSFTAPRTQRLSFGITRRIGSWSSSVSTVYRHTDFLTRRRDLNLPASPVGVDQHGRPLYGSLQQNQALLSAVAQSNRRFTSFEAVHLLESTGFSEFWGVTAGVERVRAIGLSFAAQYTYSRTTDNVAGYSGTRLSPFADGLAGLDWGQGRSDLDVPHRVLVAADWRPSDAVSLAAIYRLRSGTPFTPGVRGGVDANGDGDWNNDPAFVDATLAGMSDVLAGESCVGSQSGVFAERNSCREEMEHRIDLRATVRVARLSLGRVDLVVDALDVIAPNVGPVDRALLLVDPGGVTSANPTTGVTTVPYVTNPNFGSRVFDVTPGVFWRVGLRITP